MRVVAGVNGIETDGHGSTDLLLLELERHGFETVDVSYPEVHFWNARYPWVQKDAAVHIRDQVPSGAHLIAHSFGCLASTRALLGLGMKVGYVWFFGAALDRDTTFEGASFKALTNVRYEWDHALRGAWFHHLLPIGNPMGTAGKWGLRLFQPRVTNVRFAPDECEKGPTDPLNHSHYFQGRNLTFWADKIAETIG